MLMDDDETARGPAQTAAHASALEDANAAFNSGDYETATELFTDAVDRNARDGVTWYRYAYAKERAHNETDIHAYHRAWDLLRRQDSESDEFARAKQQVMAAIRDYSVEVRRDVHARVESIQFTNTLTGGFQDLRAAATLDGLATGSLNPGVSGRYYRVYRVSQDRLANGGWYLSFADGTDLPIN